MPRRTYFVETPTKSKLRKRIAIHFKQWIASQSTAVVNMLPGRYWRLEKSICKTAQSVHKTITLNCFERERQLADYCPWNQRVPKGVIFNFACGKKYGNFRYRQEKDKPSFSWADFCGTPLAIEIERFQNAIRLGDVVYVTFYLIPRYLPSIDEDCYRAMQGPLVGRANKMAAVLENIIRSKIKNNFTRILFESYCNGDNKSPMITIGWHFQKSSKLI